MIVALVLALLVQDEDVRPKELKEFEALRQEVETLRLLNDLKLTKEQSEKLAKISEDAQEKLSGLVKEREEALASATEALKAQKEALLKGEKVDDEKMRAAGEAQQKIGEIFRSIGELSKKAADDAKAILSAAQTEELTWWTRHDPVGQVRRWVKEMMARGREVPEEAMLEGIGGAVLEFMEHQRMIPEADREDEADRIYKIIASARDLSAEEYDKQRPELLKKVVEEGKVGEMAKKMPGRGPGPRPPEMENPIGRFFLQPRVAKLLKEKK